MYKVRNRVSCSIWMNETKMLVVSAWHISSHRRCGKRERKEITKDAVSR
jgi:hypothetical protein